MKKNLLQTICITLVALLCAGGLTAQNRTAEPNIPVQKTDLIQAFGMNLFKVVPPNTPAPQGMVNVTLQAGDLWGNESGYQMLIGPVSLWGTVIPALGVLGKCDSPPSYAAFTYKIPEDADPECTTNNIVFNNSVTIQIPFGTYAYCIVNPSYDTNQQESNFWIAMGDNGRKAGYEFQNGKAYHFLVEFVPATGNDRVVITVTDDGTPCPTVTNVTATLHDGNKAEVKWVAPAEKAFVNYKIYHNAIEVATVPAGTTQWISGTLENGNHTFGVAAVFEETDDCFFVIVKAPTLEVKTCDREVANLVVKYAKDCDIATLTWKAPGAKKLMHPTENQTEPNLTKSGVWMTWAKDPLRSVIGTYGPAVLCHRYTASDLTSYAGKSITKVRYMPYNHASEPTIFDANPRIRIYVGGSVTGTVYDPGTLVVDHEVSTYTFNVDNIIDLPEPFLITGTQEVWIGVHFTPQKGFYGASTDGDGTASYIEEKTNLIHANGKWSSTLTFFADPLKARYCWTHAAYVEYSGTVNYNVYRDGIKIAGPIEETTFEDKTFDSSQAHRWSIAVVCYNDGDSEWVSVEKEICRVGINEMEKTGFSIAPNPATHSIRISAERNFNKIEIVNFLGQTVLTQLNDKNSATVDISNLTNDIYFVRIISENGTSVQKFVKQ